MNAGRDPSGNIALVVQVRSSIGRNKKQRDTLKALGLGKINDARLRDISQPSTRGMIRSVRELVEVRPPKDAIRKSPKGYRNLLERPYQTAGMPARLFIFPDEEYVRVEAHSNAFSIGWSSELSADRAIALFERNFTLPPPQGEGDGPQTSLGVLKRDGKVEHLPPVHAVEYAHSHPDEIQAALISFREILFSWQSANIRSNRCGRYSRIAVSVESYDEDTVEQFLDHSGTPNVRARARDISSRAKFAISNRPKNPSFREGSRP